MPTRKAPDDANQGQAPDDANQGHAPDDANQGHAPDDANQGDAPDTSRQLAEPDFIAIDSLTELIEFILQMNRRLLALEKRVTSVWGE